MEVCRKCKLVIYQSQEFIVFQGSRYHLECYEKNKKIGWIVGLVLILVTLIILIPVLLVTT